MVCRVWMFVFFLKTSVSVLHVYTLRHVMLTESAYFSSISPVENSIQLQSVIQFPTLIECNILSTVGTCPG